MPQMRQKPVFLNALVLRGQGSSRFKCITNIKYFVLLSKNHRIIALKTVGRLSYITKLPYGYNQFHQKNFQFQSYFNGTTADFLEKRISQPLCTTYHN